MLSTLVKWKGVPGTDFEHDISQLRKYRQSGQRHCQGKLVILTRVLDILRNMFLIQSRQNPTILDAQRSASSGSPNWRRVDPTNHQGTRHLMDLFPGGARSVLMCMRLTQPGERVQPHISSLPSVTL